MPEPINVDKLRERIQNRINRLRTKIAAEPVLVNRFELAEAVLELETQLCHIDQLLQNIREGKEEQ